MWSARCENISCWSWLWKLKDLQYVSHYPRLNAVWFGFSRLVEEECDMILNGGYSCWASVAARFRRLGNGSSERKQGILRSVRDALLTLRHACPSPTLSCVEGRELWSRVSYHAICFFLALLVLPGDSTKSFHCTDTKLEHWRVHVITILKVRTHYGHLRLSPRSLTSPDEQTANACWYQGSKYNSHQFEARKRKASYLMTRPSPFKGIIQSSFVGLKCSLGG